MRAGLNKWWLLPFGILIASVVVALSIVVLQPALTDRLTAEVAQQTTNETTRTTADTATANCSGAPAADGACYQGHHQEAVTEPSGGREVASADCSDALASDYLCYQQRFGDLVRTNGVEATFAALKSEMAGNEFVRSNCHQMVHIIGRAAAELYDDLLSTYGQGDNFCGSGYYHGAMETIVSKIGPDKLLDKANTLCADLGGRQEYSFYRYNCTHGLGHGFMGVQENELLESLRTCDTLTDSWESNRCYGGVFMENVIAKDNPNHPSKYLKADQPLYPCDVVGNRYKNECYERQTLYALQTHGNDFSKVFDLCAEIESRFQPSCYQGLGREASVQGLEQGSNAATNGFTRTLCSIGKDYTAQFNCIVGAVDYFIRHYYSDAQAKAFCKYLGAELRSVCLQEAEEYYTSLQAPLERRGTAS